MPKILKLERRFPCYRAMRKMGAEEGDEVVLVNPSEVIGVMKRIPRGKLLTITEICKAIASNQGVSGCCSLTAGIFIMTAANAVEEAAREGRKLDIPYWRTFKANGFLNEKYPGGIDAHRKLLEKEGHKATRRGKRAFIENYQNHLGVLR